MEPSPTNTQLWAILWDLESAASTLNSRADELIARSDDWHDERVIERRNRPRADWRDVYDPDGPSAWNEQPRRRPVTEQPRRRPVSEPVSEPEAAVPERPLRRPASFASQIKPDAPSNPEDLEPTEVTGSFRNVVYGIETAAPAGRLRDLLDKRSFDRLWAESAGVDADTFANFFAEEGFGPSE